MISAATVPAKGPAIQAPVAMACSPRPTAGMTTAVTGDGRLAVTLSASSPDAGNRLSTIKFGQDARTPNPNVLLDLPGIGNGRSAPITVQAPDSATAYTFYVRRQTPGTPVNVPITVADLCGTWQTFVGGAGAGF